MTGKHITKKSVINALICILWLLAINIAAMVLVPQIPAWPMFFITIFLKYHSTSTSDVILVFVSGLIGILAAFAFGLCFGWAIAALGEAPGYTIVLLALLSAIFFGQLLFPKVVNAVCFAYLSLYFVNPGSLPMPLGIVALAAMTLVGGCVVLAGFWLAGIISDKLSSAEPKCPAGM